MKTPERLRRQLRALLRAAPYQAAALLVSLVFLLPLLWLLGGALRPAGQPPDPRAFWFPWPPAWSNFTRLFELLPFGRYLANSLFVALAGASLSALSAALAGYGMARLPRRPRKALLLFSLALLMMPVTALWLARFLLFRWLGWIDSYLALLAPALMGTSPLFVLLYYVHYRRIPAEQIEAARVDGASPLQAWLWVALPQARPAALVVAVLSFLAYWNDFIQPLLYLRSQRLFTLAIGLQQLQQMDRTNWPLMLAGALLMTLPALLVFWLAQRVLLEELST